MGGLVVHSWRVKICPIQSCGTPRLRMDLEPRGQETLLVLITHLVSLLSELSFSKGQLSILRMSLSCPVSLSHTKTRLGNAYGRARCHCTTGKLTKSFHITRLEINRTSSDGTMKRVSNKHIHMSGQNHVFLQAGRVC